MKCNVLLIGAALVSAVLSVPGTALAIGTSPCYGWQFQERELEDVLSPPDSIIEERCLSGEGVWRCVRLQQSVPGCPPICIAWRLECVP